MAVSTERRTKKTAARSQHALRLQPVHNAMPFNLPSRSPGLGALTTDTASSPSPTDRLNSNELALATQEPITQGVPLPPSKKRRSSKTAVPSELRRSSSTPHMRHLALGASGELSPNSNKPRNKLGYHRTSVACGKRATLSFFV